MNFKIIPEITGAISFVNAHRPLLLKTGGVYFLCLVAAKLLQIPAAAGAPFAILTELLSFLIFFVALVLFYINWGRIYLGYKDQYPFSYLWPRDKDALKVTGFYIIFSLLYIIALSFVAGLSFVFYAAAGALGAPAFLTIILTPVLFLYAAILSMGAITRHWFAVVARSIGEHMALRESKRRTKGATLKLGLVCMLIYVGYAIIYAPSYLSYGSWESFIESDAQQIIKTTIYSLPSFLLDTAMNAVWACVFASLYQQIRVKNTPGAIA